MIKKIKLSLVFIFLMCCILLLIRNGLAFNERITHPHITQNAIAVSNLPNYLTSNLGIQEGIDRIVRFTGNNQNGMAISTQKKVYEWLMSGSTDEDNPMCRASNHFHNPLLPWSQSFMSDDTTVPATLIRTFCNNTGWPYDQRKSNVVWATGLLNDGTPANITDNSSTDPPSPNTWNKARDYYYKALTKNMGVVRDTYLARTFQSIGQVMHLLEDMAVPAHVRNDFQSHLAFTGVSSINFTQWYNNLFEYYVKNKDSTLMASMTAIAPTFSITQKLTDFWDTEIYTGANPLGSLQQGLAEYTNANFVSDYTFTFGTGDGSGQTTTVSGAHSFPYPKVSSADRIDKTINIPLSSGTVTAIRPYYQKMRDGDSGYLLAGVSYLQFVVESISPVNPNETLSHLEIIPPMDDYVHKDYADRLLPRAVGYSAGLLNYFFRGSIEITLPDSGIYSSATNTAPGFTTIKVQAKNTTANNEEMLNGSIELVVKYRLALEDPFKAYPVDYYMQVEPYFSYIVAPEKDGVRAIPSDQPVELTFDLTTPIPLWAIEVYLQVVYHGKLGNEDGAVAVGFKDISEPTPVDLYNNMDKICLNGGWYDAGSQAAIDQAPILGWDVYAHDVQDAYLKISPEGDEAFASPSNYTFPAGTIPRGTLYRAYVLSDYDYPFNYSDYTPAVATTTADTADHANAILIGRSVGSAIKNQIDYQVADEATCAEIGETAPCDVWYYPLFYSIRGNDMWGPVGFIADNPKYPTDTNCSWELLLE